MSLYAIDREIRSDRICKSSALCQASNFAVRTTWKQFLKIKRYSRIASVKKRCADWIGRDLKDMLEDQVDSYREL